MKIKFNTKNLITLIIILVSFELFAVAPKLIPVQGVLNQADGSLINESIDLSISLFNILRNIIINWSIVISQYRLI